jgi:uncharacterized Rossmann fold enzyme
VEYSRWAPRYARIASELGYDLARERSAAEALAALLPTEARDSPFQRCRARITGRTAIVVGLAPGAGAPPLHLLRGSASPSVVPDLVVTDLDGPVPSEIAANARGSLVVVHAHADNREPVARWVPEFTGALAGSWAGPPTESLLDVGGFTDGDRAAYLAEAGGARSILLWGFAFDRAEERDPVERTRKLRKLAFARDAIGFLAASSSVPLEEWRPDGSRRPIQGGAAERSTQ